MEIYLKGQKHLIDTAKLQSDLRGNEMDLVTISKHGELVVDDMQHGAHYPYRRQVWQMRTEGEGTNNETWGDQEWEFCRSIELNN